MMLRTFGCIDGLPATNAALSVYQDRPCRLTWDAPCSPP